MMELVVLSGKGGTGKTTVAAALAHFAARELKLVLADADVDAANLGLVLSPRTMSVRDFFGGKKATIDLELCTGCGACLEACRFGAVQVIAEPKRAEPQYRVDSLACEGCRACFYRCPVEAVQMVECLSGHWFLAETRFGPLVHAHLNAGQENSGKLVMTVKRNAKDLARSQQADLLIVDGPPGIGCPVIAACAGADLALLVAEPTVASLHDLGRILATTRHFRVPAVVCINKSDLNPAMTLEIERYCAEESVPVVGRVPFDAAVTQAMVQGLTVGEWAAQDTRPAASAGGRTVATELARVWQAVQSWAPRPVESKTN